MPRKYTATDLPMLRMRLKETRRTIRAIEAVPIAERTIEDDRDLPDALTHEARLVARISKAEA